MTKNINDIKFNVKISLRDSHHIQYALEDYIRADKAILKKCKGTNEDVSAVLVGIKRSRKLIKMIQKKREAWWQEQEKAK